MLIEKAQVIDILRSLGKDTGGAEQELPDQIDTDEHSDLLGRFGISGGDLLEQFGTGSAEDLPPGAADGLRTGLPGAFGGLRGVGPSAVAGS